MELINSTTSHYKDFGVCAILDVHGRLKVQTLEDDFSTTKRDMNLKFGVIKDIIKVSIKYQFQGHTAFTEGERNFSILVLQCV